MNNDNHTAATPATADAATWYPELSDWRCELFGGTGITWRPIKGREPNAFWRAMQFLVFGNRWALVPQEPTP